MKDEETFGKYCVYVGLLLMSVPHVYVPGFLPAEPARFFVELTELLCLLCPRKPWTELLRRRHWWPVPWRGNEAVDRVRARSSSSTVSPIAQGLIIIGMRIHSHGKSHLSAKTHFSLKRIFRTSKLWVGSEVNGG